MKNLFSGLNNISNFDISKWDVSMVTSVGSMFTHNKYNYISLTKKNISFDHVIGFSYDILVAAFFYNSINYINSFKEKCIPFELFNDILKNTDEFNVFLLVSNPYIIEEYKKLNLKEKEILIQDETMYNFFNEIDAILNLDNF